jgi:hypothetical protein
MSERWNTTVTQLLGLLREALVSLVPVAEKAQIPWRDSEAYDDWEAIASCLYDNIVVRSLCFAGEVGREITMPKYGLIYPAYRGAFILVEGEAVPKGVLAAFVGFAGTSPQFECVKWVKVLPSGEVHDQKVECSLYTGCRFVLVRDGIDETARVHEVTVEL